MNYWEIEQGKLVWFVKDNIYHQDHLEMSGENVSIIVRYGLIKNKDNDAELTMSHTIAYPMLRTHPNDTHASSYMSYSLFGDFLLDGTKVKEKPIRFEFDGVLTVVSCYKNIEITRHVYPSYEDSKVWVRFVFRNNGTETVRLSSNGLNKKEYGRGVKGVYDFFVQIPAFDVELKDGEYFGTDLCYSGAINGQLQANVGAMEDLYKRRAFLNKTRQQLVLKTDDNVLDTAFAFAKIRACESIFNTGCGHLHSPGGGTYYAAVWTNDQLEYASPFFPFTGDTRAKSASINAYGLFLPFMGSDYHPIPSSIISEGLDYWEGAGDRGDASMYLHGVSRFLLANGDATLAEEFFSSIEWCVEYISRKMNSEGVIESDSDELEGRFETGEANLCTICLAYDGLRVSAALARELDKEDRAIYYETMASKLRISIESYFGGEVEGFDTYRYYKGNDVLRAWIAVPLTVGIFDRAEGTVDALLSERLWGENGLSTQAGKETFWDRSTLYALRGIFMAGKSEAAYDALKKYTRKRLLGEHVPYPVEAYPEGGQRHLSAESALYGRIIIEGLLGLVPTGFRSFALTPSLPSALPVIELKHIRSFRNNFDIVVRRNQGTYHITVTQMDGLSQTSIISEGEQADFILL